MKKTKKPTTNTKHSGVKMTERTYELGTDALKAIGGLPSLTNQFNTSGELPQPMSRNEMVNPTIQQQNPAQLKSNNPVNNVGMGDGNYGQNQDTNRNSYGRSQYKNGTSKLKQYRNGEDELESEALTGLDEKGFNRIKRKTVDADSEAENNRQRIQGVKNQDDAEQAEYDFNRAKEEAATKKRNSANNAAPVEDNSYAQKGYGDTSGLKRKFQESSHYNLEELRAKRKANQKSDAQTAKDLEDRYNKEYGERMARDTKPKGYWEKRKAEVEFYKNKAKKKDTLAEEEIKGAEKSNREKDAKEASFNRLSEKSRQADYNYKLDKHKKDVAAEEEKSRRARSLEDADAPKPKKKTAVGRLLSRIFREGTKSLSDFEPKAEMYEMLEESARRRAYKKGTKKVKKSSIHIKPENKGKFTASAKAAGEGVQEHAKKVLSNPNASTTQKKRANFARNAAKWKHEDGTKRVGNYDESTTSKHIEADRKHHAKLSDKQFKAEERKEEALRKQDRSKQKPKKFKGGTKALEVSNEGFSSFWSVGSTHKYDNKTQMGNTSTISYCR